MDHPLDPPAAKIVEGLQEFSLRGHDKRTGAVDGLTERTAGNKEKPGRGLASID